MKIVSIRAVEFPAQRDSGLGHTAARREPWVASGPVANPMSGNSRYGAYRPSWTPTWPSFGCVVEAEDGTTGFATANHGRPVAAIIDDYLGPRLTGEDALATGKIYDMAVRMCAPFGAAGLASYAVSAIDLALWDLKGKLLGEPVYRLLGGPVRDELTCYATGGDADWYSELGFGAVKLPTPYGPADGRDGLLRNVALVERTREQIGPDADIMLDCWMAFDVDYTIRLAEALRPYRIRWMEECLPSDDLRAHAELRRRLPWQTLATGEHWFGVAAFQRAVAEGIVDILQPDIQWVGGLTPLAQICGLAHSSGVPVIPHAGGNTAYGQHACLGLTGIPLTEFFIGSAPGVPLAEVNRMPGVALPVGGRITPSEAPGFGVDLDPAELRPFFG
jgi:L-rhamnonate dehydratase